MNEPGPVVVDGLLRLDGRVDVLVLGGGFQHGEGLFETLPLWRGRLIFAARHLRRLRAGAQALGLGEVPPDPIWHEEVAMLAAAHGDSDLAVRLFLFSDGTRVRRCIAATPPPEDVDRPASVGIAAPELDGPRRLAELKTLNYLVPRCAFRLGALEGFDEVIFTLPDGRVLEGSRSTIFMVKGGVILTAPLSLPILPGVTREVLLESAAEVGLPLREEPFSVQDLGEADEAFLTASLRGVRPIERFRDRVLPGADGPMTRRLSALYAARVLSEWESAVPCGSGSISPQ